MSAIVGPIELEDLLHDLPNGAQRIEGALLDLREHTPKVRIAGDGVAQVCACPARGDREHFRREVATPALFEATVRLERRAMLLDRLPERRDVLAAERLGEEDLRTALGLGERD